MIDFPDIPESVVDYVRDVFAKANDKASKTISANPSIYEETLDHILVMELTAAPPAFFASERVGVSIESHWLGHRWMWGRWEIADIAICISLRQGGKLQKRKIAIIQTKRLYSREITVAEIDEEDFIIGIGRIIDRTDPQTTLTSQRAFCFDENSTYDATHKGHDQINRIDEYYKAKNIKIYYGFYNPVSIPFTAGYPLLVGSVDSLENKIGLRIQPAPAIHDAIEKLDEGKFPTFDNIRQSVSYDSSDIGGELGWRFEKFVADEALRCREGTIFSEDDDNRLRALLYERSSPISAAIVITIDLPSDRRD